MADVDPLRAYTDARQAYEVLRAETVTKLMPMFEVASMVRNYPDALMATKLNLPIDIVRKPDPKELRFDIEGWPDLATLKLWLTDVHGVYVRMNAAWQALSEQDRRVMQGSAPPKMLVLSP